jgi:signal peptidase complex subunit 3
VRFDLEADLSGLFNWNTKQVFVYVNTEYPAEPAEGTGLGEDGAAGSLSSERRHAPGMNKAVIWDTIIPAPATEWSFANVRERYFSTKKAGTAKKSKSKSKAKKTTTATTTTTKDLTKPGLLTLKNQKPKYQITDPSGIISSRPNATLTVSWNVQPWVGPLLWDRGMLEEKNGRAGAERSWNLPFLRHQWRGGVLPRSERFDFPPLKGAQKTSEAVKDKEGPRTPEPAVVSGVV